MTISTDKRILALQRSLRENALSGYLITGSNPHLEEEKIDHWRTIEWLTGFTGSSGLLAVGTKRARLFVDPRYHLQAEIQTKESFLSISKESSLLEKNPLEWLMNEHSLSISEGDHHLSKMIGLDGRTISGDRFSSLSFLAEQENFTLKEDLDLISPLWKNRPPLPEGEVWLLEERYTGKSLKQKLTMVRKTLLEQKTSAVLVCALDHIAWILNIRGSDTLFAPLCVGHLLITQDEALWFVNVDKIPSTLKEHLTAEGIKIRPYSEVSSFAQFLKEGTLLADSQITPQWLISRFPETKRKSGPLPSDRKAQKNSIEIFWMETAALKDGLALTEFFRWLENCPPTAVPTEEEAARHLLTCRQKQSGFLGLSFPPIVGYRQHGALPHYAPSPLSDLSLTPPGLLVVDSGGQYKGGTTDITRTVSLGEPTEQQMTDYTLVLKGLIALSVARFPNGTSGHQLDVLARSPLWFHHNDYGHGTGHGVGSCLNVHEAPPSLSSFSSERTLAPLLPGMIFSNEPGCYREGLYGIRLENLLLTVRDIRGFLRFKTITFFPFDCSLIRLDLLEESEKTWVDEYHRLVWNKLSPHLTPEEKEWMAAKTSPLPR